MIFDIQTKIDLKFIKNFTKLNKLKILDLGCGIGVWNKKDIEKKFLVSKIKNLLRLKILRYSLVLKLKI